MGNSASTDAAHKESRLKSRFNRTATAAPASSVQTTNRTARAAAPRRSSAAKVASEQLLNHSETRLHLHQDAASARPAPQHSLLPIAAGSNDLSNLSSSSHRQRCLNNTRTWSLDARDHSPPSKRANSLTRTFSLSRARSLIHQRRSNSLTSDYRPGIGHDYACEQGPQTLGLVTEQAAEDNPYLRTTSLQSLEPWRPPTDIPRRSNSTGLPLLPRPNSGTDMSLFTPARRRSLRTPGVATRAPSGSTGRTSKPPSRRNSLARPQPLPILEVSAAAEGDDYDAGLMMPTNVPRAVTPNELEFAQVGAYKFGTLRITNGSPVGTPDIRSEASKRWSETAPVDYFSPNSSKTCLAEPMPNPVEKLDVRVDHNAKATRCVQPITSRTGSLSRRDSGIETSPVRERPEMRLSKADSGYSSKASVRSSYSEKMSGREAGLPRSSIDSSADLRNSQHMTTRARISPSPENQAFTDPAARRFHTTEMSSAYPAPVKSHATEQVNTPRTRHELFSLSRRQYADEGRTGDAPVSDPRREMQDGDPIRSHYQWQSTVSAGKGTLNSLFSLRRKSHDPVQATPYPPRRSRLSKDSNKGSKNLSTVGNNLVQAAAAVLPIRRSPTFQLKTELTLQLQQDDQLYQDPRFCLPTSPQMTTNLGSPTHMDVHGGHVYDRQAYPQHIAFTKSPGTWGNASTGAEQPWLEHSLAYQNSFAQSDATRSKPPPVSLQTRHGGTFSSSNERRQSNSLPAQVERTISFDRSTQPQWQDGRILAVAEPQSYIGDMTAPAIQSHMTPHIERHRSMILNTSQGQNRIPHWGVDADHHMARQQQWQESLPPLIIRPSSAGSFMAPRIPEKAPGRRVLSKAHRNPANASSGITGGSRNASLESVRSSVVTLPARPASRGHSRQWSHGSVDRDGNPVQFRVLHSYNSPAYRNVPIWN